MAEICVRPAFITLPLTCRITLGLHSNVLQSCDCVLAVSKFAPQALRRQKSCSCIFLYSRSIIRRGSPYVGVCELTRVLLVGANVYVF